METCICCGAPIPEGRQVCPKCEKEWKKKPRSNAGFNSKKEG